VGAPLKGKKVVILDDVITAGTAIRESVSLLKAEGAEIVGVVIAMDRQEKAPNSDLSAIQQVEKEYGFPVVSVIKLQNLIDYIAESGGEMGAHLENIRKYKAEYGIADA